jgi:DNA-binding protein HU-beta
MNKSQLIEELSKRVGNDKEEIRYILEELNNIILEKTRAGEISKSDRPGRRLLRVF